MIDLHTLRLQADHADLSYRQMTVAELEARGLPAAVVTAAVRAHCIDLVDAAAERLRGGLVTLGAGQAMEYQEARAQAAAALAGPPEAATPETHPMLAATIGIDRDPQTGEPAADVLGVARAVAAAYDAWCAAGAAIRRARLQAKASIAAAGTPAEVVAATEAVAWPDL